MEQIKITQEEIKELLPSRVSLYYVDYRDSLDDHHDIIQKCVSEGNKYALWEATDDWLEGGSYESESYYKKELIKDIARKYDIEEDEAEELLEEHEDFIRETIWDRDDSDVCKDLLRNTSEFVAHYDTGYYMESDSWGWPEKEVRAERQRIKKVLGIRNGLHNDAIEMMIRQASYGGNLLIFFNLDIEDFTDESFTPNTIRFHNYHIGVIDHCNGSGDICEIQGETATLPFERANVWLEKSIKYNWTYSIAGMCRGWCDSTGVELLAKKSKKEINISPTAKHLAKEAEYNKTFKEGGCTFGDMDISRHRKTEYINEFPCGNHCSSCKTFWID